jgi:transcriptional regulator with XRE-family HTH domain
MGMVIFITVDAIANRYRILTMLLVRITGSQLRAGRALADLTIEDVAARARLCRHSIRKWEGSSNAVPDAMVAHLSRAIDVLEAEGIRFTDSGVHLAAPRAIAGTAIHSEGAAA